MKLIESTLYKIKALLKEGNYDELILIVKEDATFEESLREIEKLVNWYYAHTTKSFNKEFLFSLNEIELDSLIRTFTLLDGRIEPFTFETLTPIPCLFHRLGDFKYQHFDELVDWVFKNRINKNIFPFAWIRRDEATSLNEYWLLQERDELKSEIYRLQNTIRNLEKKIINPTKATNDLKDAIKRNDSKSFSKLITKGADLNAIYEDGKILSVKIKEIEGKKFSG